MLDEYFMLRRSVWEAVVHALSVRATDMLCLRYIEEGLGRELTPADFADCPLNRRVYANVWSQEVVRRMGSPADWAPGETTHVPDGGGGS